jgi:hypothetical protein
MVSIAQGQEMLTTLVTIHRMYGMSPACGSFYLLLLKLSGIPEMLSGYASTVYSLVPACLQDALFRIEFALK